MPDSPKKTLRLPTKVANADAPYPPRRKPLRGGAVIAKHKSPVKAAASPAEPEPPARRSAPMPARSPARPATDSRPRPNGSPRPNVNPRANPRARPDASPRSDAAPRPDSGPRSNSGPRPDKGPRANASPRPDTGPRANTGSRSNFTPRSNADSRPKSSAKPKAPGPAQTLSTSDRPQSGVRVSKLLAAQGLCSRREADGYIERGWVFVNGERVTELGTRADADAVITLNTQARAMQQRQMTILLNKPVGYVSGQPEPGFTPAVTLILPENQLPGSTPLFQPAHLKGLAPAGRLDIDSTGLLVLTQDGRIARQLVGDDSSVDKEYLVRVEGKLDARGLALLNHGLSLDERELKPAKVEWINDDQLRFVLNEGRKRQIRRMCELVGLRVVGLKRVRIGGVMLGDLPVGQWRYLREDEAF